MKPVAIFRHYATEGPGYLAGYLERKALPWTLVKLDEGEPVPEDPHAFAGLAFMGGPMSVNDPLPWIPPTLALIRAAIAAELPVLGHCLGGQLMSKALGGEVTRAPTKEIGWGTVNLENPIVAQSWFGPQPTEFTVFHWHGETFSIPSGAVRILVQPMVPQSGLQCRSPPGLAVSHRDDRGVGAQLVREWRTRDRSQPKPGRAIGSCDRR